MKYALMVVVIAAMSCAAETAPGMDKTGVAPVADPEAAALVDQDSPAFKAWLENQYGERALGDDRVGADIEKVISNGPCNNNNVGYVTTSTGLGKGTAMCQAYESTSGFYACSGSFSSGTCTLAFGTGVSTYSVSSCGSRSGTVPWPGTTVTVNVANRCNVNYSTKTGYVYSGLRNTDGVPVYVYSVPDSFWHSRADFVVTSMANYSWGF